MTLPGTPTPSHSQAGLGEGYQGKEVSKNYGGLSTLTRDNLKEESRKGKGWATTRMKEIEQVERQMDRLTDRQTPIRRRFQSSSVSSMPCASIQRVEEKPPCPSPPSGLLSNLKLSD